MEKVILKKLQQKHYRRKISISNTYIFISLNKVVFNILITSSNKENLILIFNSL